MLQVIAFIAPLLTGGVITQKPSSAPVVEYVQHMQGKRIDYDGAYWYQCYDLMMHFKRAVYWEKERWAWTALKTRQSWKWFETWTRYKPWILTSPPKPGSIIFIDVNHRKWHVWVVVDSNTTSVTVLEQNGWYGKWKWQWKDAIRKRVFNYADILWWYSK